MMRFERTIAVLVLATGVICSRVTAAEPEERKYPPKAMTEVGTNPWVPLSPKSEHAILSGLTGKFKSKVHLYSGPFVRMLDTEGTAEGKSLMGGAFVQLTHSEKRMKQLFEAMTVYGFDHATRKYTASALDSTSTAIVTLIGTYDAAKKQLVMTGRYSDQKGRFLTIIRTETTFVDENTWTYEEFISHKAGDPETKVVTITLTRS